MAPTANSPNMTSDFHDTYPEANPVTSRIRKRRRMWSGALLVAGGLGLYFVATRAALAPSGWSENVEAALQEARSAGKSAVLDFYLDGCPPCVAMDQVVLSSEAVRAAIAEMAAIRVNAAKHRALAERYRVFATPTFIVIDPEGRELARAEGYLPPEEFVAFLNSAKRPQVTPPADPTTSPAAP